jgi:hypothetical protein
VSVDETGKPGGSDSNGGDATSSTSIVGSGWHMIAYTFTGVPNATDNGSLFVDGVLVAHDTVPLPTGDGYDVWIGGSPDYGTSRLLPGSIAQAAVFTNALSAAQVQALYKAASVTPPIKLIMIHTGDANMALVWPGGTLLQSTSLFGPWSVNAAGSPYTFAPTDSEMYFRVSGN